MFREFRAARERAQDAYELAVANAWWSVNLGNRKQLPALEDVLRRLRPAPKQTVSDQKTMLLMLSEQYGIPLRKARKKKKPKPTT